MTADAADFLSEAGFTGFTGLAGLYNGILPFSCLKQDSQDSRNYTTALFANLQKP